MSKEIKEIRSDITDVKINIAQLPELLMKKMDERYVSKDSFSPVQKIAYGVVGSVLTAVLVAIMALVVQKS